MPFSIGGEAHSGERKSKPSDPNPKRPAVLRIVHEGATLKVIGTSCYGAPVNMTAANQADAERIVRVISAGGGIADLF
jgi:hypothetical protein